MSTPEVCVIFNPRAGRDRARSRLLRLKKRLGPRAAFWPTEQPGHAEELAREAALAGFAAVAAAGGDGTVHEVANGLLRAGRPDVVLEVYPVGSANDYADCLGLDANWKLRPPGAVRPTAVDVGLVRAADGRSRYFVNGLGLGFNAHVTLESRGIGFFQGPLLYNLAVLAALWRRFEAAPMTVVLDGERRREPTLALTLALGRREGNFVLAPDAVLDDGLFDYLHAGALSRYDLVRNLLRVNAGLRPDHPQLWRGRCRSARIEADTPLPIHLDGELFATPADGVRAVDVSLLPGALRVMANPRTVLSASRRAVRGRRRP